MEQIKHKLTQEQLQQIQALRSLFLKNEPYTGKLKDAIKEADEFTERTGLKAWVIKKRRKYEAVYEGYFDTYKYKGKIYYQTNPKLDAET